MVIVSIKQRLLDYLLALRNKANIVVSSHLGRKWAKIREKAFFGFSGFKELSSWPLLVS